MTPNLARGPELETPEPPRRSKGRLWCRWGLEELLLAVRWWSEVPGDPWAVPVVELPLLTQHKFRWLSRENTLFWFLGGGTGGWQPLLLGTREKPGVVRAFPRPSPTRQVAAGVPGRAQGEGQSVSESELGRAGPDCTCNQGISHSKLWSFRLLEGELNFRPKRRGYSETQ